MSIKTHSDIQDKISGADLRIAVTQISRMVNCRMQYGKDLPEYKPKAASFRDHVRNSSGNFSFREYTMEDIIKDIKKAFKKAKSKDRDDLNINQKMFNLCHKIKNIGLDNLKDDEMKFLKQQSKLDLERILKQVYPNPAEAQEIMDKISINKSHNSHDKHRNRHQDPGMQR